MICGKAPCGMSYAVRRSSSAVAYCSLGIRCGTRNEKGFSGGIAHFTEHALFKGTESRSAGAISNCLDRLGGELNAFTTKEEIVLHATVLKEDVRKAVSLLLELSSQPTFPRKEIEIERGVILEEIQAYKDSPSEDVYDMFECMLFRGHPLGEPILGTAESVKGICPEELSSFVKAKFRPGAMAFSIVVDMEEGRAEAMLLKLMEKYFPHAGGQESVAGVRPACGEDYFLPDPVGFDRTVEKNNHEANAVTGFLAPSLYDEKERACAILACNLIAGPASNSILNNVLREKKGWVYGVESSYTQYSDTGIMTISLGCDRQNLDRCRETIAKELGRLMDAPLSPSRLRAARRQLLGQLAISSDNGESQCLSMGKSLLAFGSVASDNYVRNLVESIEPGDLRNTICRIFGNENLSTLVFL